MRYAARVSESTPGRPITIAGKDGTALVAARLEGLSAGELAAAEQLGGPRGPSLPSICFVDCRGRALHHVETERAILGELSGGKATQPA